MKVLKTPKAHLSARIRWQVELVLLGEILRHEAATQPVPFALEVLGAEFWGCERDEELWLQPVRVTILYIPT